jgi:hypothetical protein
MKLAATCLHIAINSLWSTQKSTYGLHRRGLYYGSVEQKMVIAQEFSGNVSDTKLSRTLYHSILFQLALEFVFNNLLSTMKQYRDLKFSPF